MLGGDLLDEAIMLYLRKSTSREAREAFGVKVRQEIYILDIRII